MIQWKWLNEEKLYKVYKNGDIYFMPIEMNMLYGVELYTNKVTVFITENGKCVKRYVDELIYNTFVGKIKKTCKLVHIDETENNINLENLKQIHKKQYTNNIPQGWKVINGYDNKYIANRDGNIKSLYGKQTLLTYESRILLAGTFSYVYLKTSEKRYFERVDKIIYETFKGILSDENIFIFHKNGNNVDNSLTNLQACIPEIKADFNAEDFPKWIPIIGYETKYECNADGNIRNIKTQTIFKGSNCSYEGMYKRIKLYDNNNMRTEYNLHRILYESFLGKKLNQQIVIDHIDKNKLNNNISNLRATTQSINVSNKIYKKHNIEEINILDEQFTNIKKTIDNYDFSEYECNKYGQIKSLVSGKLLRGFVDKGYKLYDMLDKTSNKTIKLRAHRIVASVFLPNPNMFDVVHHKDANRTNNNVDNLEWTTQQQNTIHSVGRKVGKYDLTGNLIKIYNSISSVDDVKFIGHISSVCSGKRNSTQGYKWKYMD